MTDLEQPQRGPTDQQTTFLPSRPSLDWRPAAWEDQDVSLPTFSMDDFDIGTNHDWILPVDTASAEKVSHDIRTGEEKPAALVAQPWRHCVGAFQSLFEQMERLTQENARLRQQCSKIDTEIKATKE